MSGPTSNVPGRKRPKADRVYIQLGRTGDSIASVPLCYLYWKETGKKAALMVHRSFASFLEGISYIEPEIYDGDWRDVNTARRHCLKLGYRDIVIAQIYGHGVPGNRTQSSFILESWNNVGRLADFDRVPLVFDRRNLGREAALAATLPTGLPIVLVAADGHSAAVPFRAELFSMLHQHLAGRAHIVDLAQFRTRHFHDFLGLFDRAACLVTGDTGFGQLACASRVPVCALIAYLPSTWHSSPQRRQHICYIRYNEWEARKKELLDAVDGCVGMPRVVALHDRPVIHHVWTGTMAHPDTLRRMNCARQTWVREAQTYGAWRELRFTDEMMLRSARDVGDPTPLPYLHDMMDAVAQDAKAEDILLLSNADICMVPGLSFEAAEYCRQYGACYCHRWDFPRVVTHIERQDITGAQWYIGCDLFAVTKQWWMAHRAKLPPFILGRECWDWAWRILVQETGGRELPQGIYHEKHASPWEQNRGLPGNVWNRSHCRAFLQQRGLPLQEIAHESFIPVKWPVGA